MNVRLHHSFNFYLVRTVPLLLCNNIPSLADRFPRNAPAFDGHPL